VRRTDIASGPDRSTPAPMEAHERARLEAAAEHATRVYPGPVGELLARELRAHVEFGYRFGRGGLITRVACRLLATPATHGSGA
jgi:hypothetical protein